MAENSSPVMAGPRMDRLPMTRTHYKSFFLLAGGSFFDGFDVYLAGGVLAAMAAAGFSTVTGNAAFISFTFIGLYFGTLLAGYFGDRFGRKFAMKYSLLVYSLATIACAAAPNFDHLVVYRTIAGFGLGGVIITGYTFWVELHRRRPAVLVQCAVLFDQSVPAGGGAVVSDCHSRVWVAFYVLDAGIPPMIIWFLQLRYMPESPRWLEKQNRNEEAERVLRQFESGAGELAPVEADAESARDSGKNRG